MVDVISGYNIKRTAFGRAIVKLTKIEALKALLDNFNDRENVLEIAKAAGLFALKRTGLSVTNCDKIPIEFTSVNYRISEMSINIDVELRAIYKDTIEFAAMHGAAVTALTIYNRVKPSDERVTITSISGKEVINEMIDFKRIYSTDIKAAVIICSDSIQSGNKRDKAGRVIVETLERHRVRVTDYSIIADDISDIRRKIVYYYDLGNDIIILSGGTGLSPRDVTPEAIAPLFDRDIPGIMESARSYGQERTPYSMLSRGISGMMGNTLILAIPGSTKGAAETMDVLFPSVLQIFKYTESGKHLTK